MGCFGRQVCSCRGWKITWQRYCTEYLFIKYEVDQMNTKVPSNPKNLRAWGKLFLNSIDFSSNGRILVSKG